MKYIYCLLVLLQAFIVNAQTLNETVYFIIDKPSECQSFNDTLHIEGMLLNPEQRSLSRLSNYCYVEIMDKTAKVLDRIKIRCHNSLFSCSFPLDSISIQGNYFVRAYTRYMQNFSPSAYPIQIFSVGVPQNIFIPTYKHPSFPFQPRYKDGILLYKLNKDESNKAYSLTIAAEDGSMETLSLAEHPEGYLKITNENIAITDMNWLPEVTVKARIIKQIPPSTNIFFKNRYFEAKDLEQSSYTDLKPIFEQMIGVRIVYTKEGEPYLISTRGSSLFDKEKENKKEGKEGDVPHQGIRIRIDGIWDDRRDIFHLVNVSDIASIEYISPSRTNIYGPGNMMGAIEIKTKSISKGHHPIKSMGKLYKPFGLTYSAENKGIFGIASINIKKEEETKFLLKLPSASGNYQIIVEGIKENGTLVFISRDIEIKDRI